MKQSTDQFQNTLPHGTRVIDEPESSASIYVPADLPTPSDFPQSDIVIFDGKCVFCTRGVRQLKWLDQKNRISFVSLHDPFALEICPDLTYDELMEQIYLVTPSGQRFAGAGAIRHLSTRLPKLWLIAPLMYIPFSMPLWNWAYRQIAKRRYKIANVNGEPCDVDGTCEIHFDK